ncbi:MAG TPA: secretin N-terminal domain-containing protein [Methylomirabilota bacterium]|nr:secretin N-terminal domain-containing protein [Methylomirabilota bacterium]
MVVTCAAEPPTGPEDQAPGLTEQNAGLSSWQAVGVTDFTELPPVFELYGKLVGRTILIPTSLPAQTIKTIFKRPLNRQEAVQALDAVLGLNGIAMIEVGERFVKAVPTSSPCSGSARESEPGLVTLVVQLTNARPSTLAKKLGALSSFPGAVILALDPSQILVTRDRPENIKSLLDVLPTIDAAPDDGSQVIPVKYALASEVAAALIRLSTNITPIAGRPENAGAGVGSSARGGLGSHIENLLGKAAVTGDLQGLGQIKITADERSNSLLVFASEPDIWKIKRLVSQFDVVSSQILIEAVILEVSLDGMEGSKSGQGNKQHPQPDLVTKPGDQTNVAGAPFGRLGQAGDDLEELVSALATNQAVTILQRPRIQTSVDVAAQMLISDSFPRSVGYCGGAFPVSQSLPTNSVTLEVTPSIDPSGAVVMEIRQIVEKPSGTMRIASIGEVPITTRQDAKSTVTVRDHATVLLGGLVTEHKEQVASGAPLLKSIPLLGALFRTTSTRVRTNELIVLIRPTILPEPARAAQTDRSGVSR